MSIQEVRFVSLLQWNSLSSLRCWALGAMSSHEDIHRTRVCVIFRAEYQDLRMFRGVPEGMFNMTVITTEHCQPKGPDLSDRSTQILQDILLKFSPWTIATLRDPSLLNTGLYPELFKSGSNLVPEVSYLSDWFHVCLTTIYPLTLNNYWSKRFQQAALHFPSDRMKV